MVFSSAAASSISVVAPQVMQPHRREVRLLDQSVEGVGQVVRRQRLVMLVRKQPRDVIPAALNCLPCLLRCAEAVAGS
jgi:hypothetical protein